MQTFVEKLTSITKKNDTLLCVGLDTDSTKIPSHLKKNKYPIFEFNREIIESTHDLVCAYKPNIAFYMGAGGLAGLLQLKRTMDYLIRFYPEIPLILDAKVGDIENTNIGYVKFIYDYLGADAVTLNPYLGKDALKPFLDRSDKGIFILCHTSNPGSGEFQDLKIENKPLYQIIAQNVSKNWNYNGNCGLVVGATFPEELKTVRQIVKDMPILIPGIGNQGGDLEEAIIAGVGSNKMNAIINSSRNILYSSNGTDFAQKARDKAEELKNQINKFRRKNG